MEFLALDDPEWLTTFPYRVKPYSDEWLVSVLLRCDEVNQWQSGETFRHLLRITEHYLFGPRSSLLVVPMPILEALARLLMLPVEQLLATTYVTELARLYRSSDPGPGLLLGLQYTPGTRRWRPSERLKLISQRVTHICPVCIAQTRTMGRTITLPHLRYCPIHNVAFQERCVCGREIVFFLQWISPFKCYACRLDWAQLPQVQIPPDQVALEHYLFTLYNFFLSKGTEELKKYALRLAGYAWKGEESVILKLTGRRISLPATLNRSKLPLGHVIEVLVSAGISLSDIIDDDIPLL